MYASRSSGGGATTCNLASAAATSSRDTGKGCLATGTHCSSPSSSTVSRPFTSSNPWRTFTVASLSRKSRYRSALSSKRSTSRAPSASSAAPKSSPNVLHSHRGTISTDNWTSSS